ncbi:DNA recombination protein RmuC [Nocardiopsis valliformis]|uniref:DNA recombination protein RmuC n=1 Tax=Nocardiopsis valliformis TaxID=239974 RepID=UPI001EF9FCBF|nr:DNA recombination protein RmuC [Nocardiopsis valliformis]
MLIIALVVVTAAVFAALGYLFARHRTQVQNRDHGDEQNRLRTELRLTEEQRDQARTQAGELRTERDEAQKSQRERESAWSELTTRLNAVSEERGRLETEGKATGEKLGQARSEIEGLRKSLDDSRRRVEELEGALIAEQQGKAAVEAVNADQRARISGYETDLATLRTERAELEKRRAEVAAAQKELDKVREEHNRLQTEQVEATVAKMLESSQEKLTAAADEKLGTTARAVTEKLQELGLHLREFDGRRTTTETRLDEQLKNLAQENARGRAQTEALVKALRKPQVRGRWGELQLRKAVELADMRERCDFDTQVSVTDEEGTQRPDMIVNLTSGRRVVVDAKVSLDAFMNALEADGDDEYDRFMDEHAAQVRKHVDTLAAKEYFVKVAGSPDFVLMFLPNESLLQAALDRKPDLYEHALAKKIIIATPTVLIPMLRTIALSWDEKAMRENTEVIHGLGREIYDRLTKVGEHLGRLRGSLDKSVEHYNAAIGSLEARVLPTAREFPKLGIRPKKELTELHPVERQTRALVAPELLASTTAEAGTSASGTDLLEDLVEITPEQLD